METKPWFVYILECRDGSFYTGVTNDLEKRMETHAKGKGSKYVQQKGFKKLLRAKECESKSDAQKCEYQIKQLPRNDKLDWFDNTNYIVVT
ncbi:MAG: GIY-YIG nuclease family protein [archaeon]